MRKSSAIINPQEFVPADRPGANVVAMPYLVAGRRIDAVAPYGSSVAEIVAMVLPGLTPEIEDFVRVYIEGEPIPRECWARARLTPKNDNLPLVFVRVLPGNSGALRAALSISVAVAAIALGQVWAAPSAFLAGSALGTAIGLTPAAAGSIITATTLLAGTFLINALVPIRQDQSRTGLQESPTYALQGFRNVANPDGAIPFVLGKISFAPPYAALPYTHIENGETYIIALFLLGYGPLYIDPDKIRIGDTPISKFKEVQYEIREGYPSDLPVTLYPKQVLEERLSVDLSAAYSAAFGAPSRFTASDADEAQVDIAFPGGLFVMHTDPGSGNTPSKTYPLDATVFIRISYRLEGAGAWTLLVDWPISAKTQKAVSFAYRWKFPARGRYEVRVERQTADLDDLNAFDQYNNYSTNSIWTALKSFRPEYPLNFDKPLALIAVKVRASKQLNGVLDNLNCEVSRICPDWDAGTSTWIERETQNPASLYRYALQGPAVAYPLTDAEIDLAQVQDWHGFCATENLKYNRVHDYEASMFDVMGDICAAGRAAPHDDGAKWGVAIDRKKTITIAHITPRNAWSFSFERPYVTLPDAFRVKFYDETNHYKPAERLVPFPGFVGTPSRIEAIEFPGVTNPDQIWLEARKRQYELIYRRDIFYAMQDFEGAIARRDDLVRFSHDILDSTQVSAFVKAVSGSNVTLDEWVTMEAGKNYVLRIRKLATSEAGDDLSISRSVKTVAGETATVVLSGGGVAPEVGDLVMFGELSRESEECVVREIEGAEDFSQRFTLIPHAPEIFDLLALEVPPPWNGRVGAEVGGPAGPALKFSDKHNSQYLIMGWP